MELFHNITVLYCIFTLSVFYLFILGLYIITTTKPIINNAEVRLQALTWITKWTHSLCNVKVYFLDWNNIWLRCQAFIPVLEANALSAKQIRSTFSTGSTRKAVGCGGVWRIIKREGHFSHRATNTSEMVKDDSINHHPPLTP